MACDLKQIDDSYKGLGQNLDCQRRKQKQEIIRRIAMLDDWSEERELSHMEWEERYALDHIINQLLLEEELQWQRRCLHQNLGEERGNS